MTASKLKIVYNQLGSLNSAWLEPLLRDHFDLEFYDSNKTYTSRDIAWLHTADNAWVTWSGPQVRDCLWDAVVDQQPQIVDDQLHVSMPDWVWINESLWWRHLGYADYFAATGGDKFFLMPMSGKRRHRDLLFNVTAKFHDQSLRSYRELGVLLPGDLDFDHGDWERYCNMSWYDSTNFSVVAETTVQGAVFVSEKSYKPMAYGHPAVIYGTQGLLKYLRAQGFATFDHVLDESYDAAETPTRRLKIICDNLDRLYSEFCTGTLFADAETQRRLQHNHHRFFDSAEVTQRFQQQFIEPLLHYVS